MGLRVRDDLVDARGPARSGARLPRRARVVEVEVERPSEVPVVGVQAVPDERHPVGPDAGLRQHPDRRDRPDLGVHAVVRREEDQRLGRVVDVQEAPQGLVARLEVPLHGGLVRRQHVLGVVRRGHVEEVRALPEGDLAGHPEHPEVDLEREDLRRGAGGRPMGLGVGLHVDADVEPRRRSLVSFSFAVTSAVDQPAALKRSNTSGSWTNDTCSMKTSVRVARS